MACSRANATFTAILNTYSTPPPPKVGNAQSQCGELMEGKEIVFLAWAGGGVITSLVTGNISRAAPL
jgi:hypothetical protein